MMGAAVLARPKSRSFAPDFVSMTLAGFRSRCTICERWARWSASADLAGDLQRLGQRDGAGASQPARDGLAFEILQDQKANRVIRGARIRSAGHVCFTDVEQRTDVWVLQRGNGARLALESIPGEVAGRAPGSVGGS